MAKIENIHCTICIQPISSSWQNALPPAFASLEQPDVMGLPLYHERDFYLSNIDVGGPSIRRENRAFELGALLARGWGQKLFGQ